MRAGGPRWDGSDMSLCGVYYAVVTQNKDDELKLAKDYLIGSFPLRLDTTAKVADFVVAIEEQGLGLDYADRYKASIAKVTAADVQRVAQKFLQPDTFNRVVVGATK